MIINGGESNYNSIMILDTHTHGHYWAREWHREKMTNNKIKFQHNVRYIQASVINDKLTNCF